MWRTSWRICGTFFFCLLLSAQLLRYRRWTFVACQRFPSDKVQRFRDCYVILHYTCTLWDRLTETSHRCLLRANRAQFLPWWRLNFDRFEHLTERHNGVAITFQFSYKTSAVELALKNCSLRTAKLPEWHWTTSILVSNYIPKQKLLSDQNLSKFWPDIPRRCFCSISRPERKTRTCWAENYYSLASVDCIPFKTKPGKQVIIYGAGFWSRHANRPICHHPSSSPAVSDQKEVATMREIRCV